MSSRKAQRKIGVLKQHMEASLEKELTAHQYLASIVTLAEKTTLERDQLMHMVRCPPGHSMTHTTEHTVDPSRMHVIFMLTDGLHGKCDQKGRERKRGDYMRGQSQGFEPRAPRYSQVQI